MEKKLRTGFTTGTCATAAAKACLLAIVRQEAASSVSVRLPRGDSIKIAIKRCSFGAESASCSVIKDGGDDPDVTHGAEIIAGVAAGPEPGRVIIEGGAGVGTVTKPGLGLEIGGPAINPVPRKMIAENAADAAPDLIRERGITVTISVPDGAALAPKTDNPRLGITGGISILGTSGIVVPFSTASYAAAIRQNISVAVAMGDSEIVLATGGRSEEYAGKITRLSEHCYIQVGDFVGYAVQECKKQGVKKAYIAGFIGKMAKMAAGVKQTHVKGSKVDMGMLAEMAQSCGAQDSVTEKIRGANTARHVQEIILQAGVEGFFETVCSAVRSEMDRHAGGGLSIEAVLFDFDGTVLARR